MAKMLVLPFIYALVTIILILFSPCILKLIYKNKKFFGYGLGFCCFIVTNIVNFLILTFSLVIIGLYKEEYFESIKDKQENKTFNYEEMLSLSTELKIFFSIIYSLLNINSFFMTFKFTKRLANQHHIYNVIFTFISGYLLLYIFAYLGLIYLSFYPDDINIEIPLDMKLNKDYILLAIELIVTIQMFGFMGTSIMLFIHQKRASNAIIWLCIISYFFPIIIFIVGLFLKSSTLLFLPLLVFDLASLLLGTIFYCKFADSNLNGPINVESLLQTQSAVVPPY